MFNQVTDSLASTDPDIWAVVQDEAQRQEAHIELIASENYTSPAVLQALGSQLTNKYAEGYPGRRYYGGCEVVDRAETLAIQRACELFGAEAANVQPHSGSQANQAVFFALLQPGDRILGMDLNQGGHLTHGMPLNISGKWFQVSSYGLNAQCEIDYDAMERLAHQVRPRLIIAGASAYSLRIDFERFARVARAVGAYLMVDMAHYAGLVAAEQYPSPIPHADVVTTTTHKGLRGPRGGLILMKRSFARAIDAAIFPGLQGGPLMNVIAAKAVALREAATPAFVQHQRQVLRNAQVMAETLQARGLSIVSGRTESHLMLVDLRDSRLTGLDAQQLLEGLGLTCNKNAVPGDPRKAALTSGIRLGSPAMTTRGFGEDEARQVAVWVADALQAPEDEALLAQIRHQVRALCARFPVYR
ncbi:serine hydroxymethyltransferase [Inhella proteolytica]|uniref:Serine hydroxymethyltransferase n=1 Tax=Inhella proteolytica TaxID=2795029 RepID=A0A931J1Q0_9BURK|nr:serine hydroxymethyltransferase [Inhella proteolytica]MBH9577929.1 serine hydroxymethyltransferase [Inhella proteolytica]